MNNIIEFTFKKINLNEQQFEIVTETTLENKKLLLSCAGSGKTLTLTSRICYMINELNCKPKEFIICTFNRNAAEEMKKRINGMIGITDIKCGTFHSIGMKILNSYDYLYFDENFHIDETLIFFLNFLKSERSLNFRKNIKYLFVDEFQDINKIQLDILKELSKSIKYLFFVGDDLQNIYTFRGSNNNIIMNLHKHFNNINIYKILINYRSPPEIIKLANEIQTKNKNQKSKIMIPNKKSYKKPEIHKFKNLSQEIKFIIKSIKDDLKNNYKRKDICVLCRNNMPLYFVEEQLQYNKIKNKILSGENIILNQISLSTIHSAKGLEWAKVYLIGMNQSYFPNSKSDIEEERRLLYVATTRAKEELIISFNENDKCSSLLTELREDLFNKDFNFSELDDTEKIQINKPIDESVTVSGIIKKLNGQDYVKLKKLKIFEDIKFTNKKIYSSYEYPKWIIKNNFFSEFGIFVDYLIRRMIADLKKNKNDNLSGIRDRRADEVILNIPLFGNDYNFLLKNHKKFDLLHRLQRNNTNVDIKEIQKLFRKINGHISKKDIELYNKIFSQILNFSKKFNVETDKINISNKIYIPFQLENIMHKHYIRYTNKNKKWDKLIWDIFMISKCHSIWGNRRKTLYVPISEKKILSLTEFYNDINNYIIRKIRNSKYILSNPKLNNGMIYGDADLIVDNEIIDFKTSNNTNLNIEHTLQLLIYTSLARYKGMTINKISIFNPLKGNYKYCDITNWDKDEELLEYLCENI